MSYSDNYHSQTHVHEVQGSVKIAELIEDPHNHRFATVSSEIKRYPDGSHTHIIRFRTDFYENHYHEFVGETSAAVRVGDRHVHYLNGYTTYNDGHRHEFRLATFIEDPIGD